MRKSAIIGAVLLGGIALAGCSPAEYDSEQPPAPGTPPAEAPKRVADPAAAEHGQAGHGEASGPAAELLINREQLNQLAELAERNSQNPQVKQLAADLKGALEPQLTELRELAGEAPEPPESNLGGATGQTFDQQWKQEVRSLLEQSAELADQAKSAPDLNEIATEITEHQKQALEDLNALG
ncbi:hypothetical protein [Saccharopolyspora griseoalba]|uniref:DUF305 domain-containing protein n=1 Tax=Saccharopolyspora griseoalba TaxID=1431848 RepID=A0ABW2LNF1_9PSEU